MEGETAENIIELAAMLAGKADQIDEVLILYTTKTDDMAHSLDNNLTVASALYLVESFKFWLMAKAHSPKT